MAEVRKITATVEGAGVLCRDANGVEVKTGGGGPSALDLLLMAVAGCSGAVLRAVLAKEGFTPERVEISVEGERADHPRRFSGLRVHFDVVCPGITREKLGQCLVATERACPVIQTLSAEVKMTFALAARRDAE